MVDTLQLAGTIALVSSNGLALASGYIEIRKLRREVESTQIVIKNTEELRHALRRPLEGIWTLRGTFDRFQGKDEKHYTHGYMAFNWSQQRSRYEVIYVYSVTRTNEADPEVTVICGGFTNGEFQPGSPGRVSISFTVESRTSIFGTKNEARSFEMKMTSSGTGNRSDPQTLEAAFSNQSTSGKLRLER